VDVAYRNVEVTLEKPIICGHLVSVLEIVHMFSPIFELCKDTSVTPKINSRNAAKAIRKYGDSHLEPDDVLLLIDNTIFRSAKQGIFITEDRLFAYSEISGKYSIELSDIETIKIEIRSPLKVKIPGITVNGEYFISLPGMGEILEYQTESYPALLVLATFMVEAFGCKLTADERESKVATKSKRPAVGKEAARPTGEKWLPGGRKSD
tara:strand:- start:911 stop:1534 length:624 start_codon:yes stop_codon:yes gene_type:complete